MAVLEQVLSSIPGYWVIIGVIMAVGLSVIFIRGLVRLFVRAFIIGVIGVILFGIVYAALNFTNILL
ncbi:MAG: hypothetical protein WD740_08430 [Anaerolineales bacterium]